MFHTNSWANIYAYGQESSSCNIIKTYAVLYRHHGAWVKFLCVPLTAEMAYLSQGKMVFTTEGLQEDYYTQKIQFFNLHIWR